VAAWTVASVCAGTPLGPTRVRPKRAVPSGWSTAVPTTAAGGVAAPDGTVANLASTSPTVSGDGRFVAFESRATNLDPASGCGVRRQIFVRDLAANTVRCVSVTPDGQAGDGESTAPAISRDGQVVAFASTASNLVPGAHHAAQPAPSVHRPREAGAGPPASTLRGSPSRLLPTSRAGRYSRVTRLWQGEPRNRGAGEGMQKRG
jgi:Tol biopolymer transport system component